MKFNGLLILLASTLCLGGSLANSNTNKIETLKTIKEQDDASKAVVEVSYNNEELSFETNLDKTKYEIVDVDLLNENVLIETIGAEKTSFTNLFPGVTYYVRVNYKDKGIERGEIFSIDSERIQIPFKDDTYNLFKADEITFNSVKIVKLSSYATYNTTLDGGTLYVEGENEGVHVDLNYSRIENLKPNTNYIFKADIFCKGKSYFQNIKFKTKAIDVSKKHLYLNKNSQFYFDFYVSQDRDTYGMWDYTYTLYKNDTEVVATTGPTTINKYSPYNLDIETSYKLKVYGEIEENNVVYATFEDEVSFNTPRLGEVFTNLYELDIHIYPYGFLVRPSEFENHNQGIIYGNYKVYHKGELIYDEQSFSHPIDAVIGEEYTVTQDYSTYYQNHRYTSQVSKTFTYNVANEITGIKCRWNPDGTFVNVETDGYTKSDLRLKSVKIFDLNGKFIDESSSSSFVSAKLGRGVTYRFEVRYEIYGINGELIEKIKDFEVSTLENQKYEETSYFLYITDISMCLVFDINNVENVDGHWINVNDFKVDSAKLFDENDQEVKLGTNGEEAFYSDKLMPNTSYRIVMTYSYISSLTNERVIKTKTYYFTSQPEIRLQMELTPIKGGFQYNITYNKFPGYYVDILQIEVVDMCGDASLVTECKPAESGEFTGLFSGKKYFCNAICYIHCPDGAHYRDQETNFVITL